MRPKLRLTFGVVFALLLTACGKETVVEMNAWLAEQKRAPVAKPVVTPEPIKFVPATYELGHLVDPFSVRKMVNVAKSEKQSGGSQLISKELERRKEPLEQYPRESITFTGSLLKNGQPAGLISVGKQLFYVKLGDYMGQNFGRVIKITDSELVLREIIQNASGDWEERVTTLRLQENSK
jgi:type IV pilus assembly protein PilP